MYDAIVIGVSAGGFQALKIILPRLPEMFRLPIAIVQHMAQQPDSFLASYLNRISAVTVKEAEVGEPLLAGTVYLAPPGYHLLVEPDKSFSLSVDARINYSCPSIDVLFESAADAYRKKLIGVVLTGANNDGSKGLKIIKKYGGLTVVQDPETAESPFMPRAAIEAVKPDHIAALEDIAPLLVRLAHPSQGEIYGTGTH